MLDAARSPADLTMRASLYTVSRHWAIDRSRRRHRWREVELRDVSDAALPTLPDDADRPRSKFRRSRARGSLLAGIPRRLRSVFGGGLACQGSAGRLGLPLGTVATRLGGARHPNSPGAREPLVGILERTARPSVFAIARRSPSPVTAGGAGRTVRQQSAVRPVIFVAGTTLVETRMGNRGPELPCGVA
jgi:hypothetical protein